MSSEESKPKVLVIGDTGTGYAQSSAINELSKTYDVAIVDDILKSRDYLNTIKITNPYMLPRIEEKKFRCKGNKHQYSLVGDDYICTCGKKL